MPHSFRAVFWFMWDVGSQEGEAYCVGYEDDAEDAVWAADRGAASAVRGGRGRSALAYHGIARAPRMHFWAAPRISWKGAS